MPQADFAAVWRSAVAAAAPVTLRGWLLGAEVQLVGETVAVAVPTTGEALGISRLQDPAVRERLEEELARQWGSPLQIEASAGAAAKLQAPPPSKAAPGRAPVPERLIFGKSFSGAVTPLREVSLDLSRVVVEAEIVSVDVRARRGGGQILTLALSDHDDGLVAKLLLDPEAKLGTELRPGMWIRLRGNVGSDERTGEPLLWARDLMQLMRSQQRSEEASRGRVELHLHTRMSQMDGLLDLPRVVDAAERFSMPAIAVTDHGVLQAYPEAQDLARKSKVRLLYGLEAYVVPDSPRIVIRPVPAGLPQSFVALDVETTSLSPQSGEIIEIALVRFVDGQAQEEFVTLVRPKGKVSQKTVDLTGISPQDLEGAPSFADVLPRVLEFLGDLPVVAHNAGFDEGYLRTSLVHQDIDWRACVIDTLELGRALVPHLRSHRLQDLAQHFELGDFAHHRAGADAEIAGRIALRLFDAAKLLGVEDLAGLNGLGEKVPLHLRRPYHAMLLVRTQEGLRELYRAVTEAHLRQFHRVPRLVESQVQALRQGAMLGAAGCLQGELWRAFLRGASPAELREIARRYDYIELQPPGLTFPVASAEGYLFAEDEVRRYAEQVIEIADELSLPVVATGDAHYLEPEEQELRRIVLRGAGREAPGEAERPLHLRTASEMLRDFAWLGAERAEHIVFDAPDAVAQELGDLQPVPDELSAPELPEAAEEVEKGSRRRAAELYGDPLPEVVSARLERELKAVIGNGFASIYRIAQLLTRRSLEDGYLVGSRGSVGSSFVAYLIGITEVNPLAPHWRCPGCQRTDFSGEAGSGFDLPQRACPDCGASMARDGQDIPFETFMGFDGDKVPDIDLNFSGDYQPQIHRYTEELLGGQVYRAGTIATVAERTAFGLAKGYLEERGRTVRAPEIERLARGVTGVKRTTGQHPGGVMVVPVHDDVHRFTPLQHPADDTDSNIITTHFDYHAISSRLLKLDLLGHDDPTVLRLLEQFTGIPALSVPCDDAQAISLFSSCEALGLTQQQLGTSVGSFGLPEFGTRFVRQMLEATRPSSFADLVRISGLSHGTDVWTRNADELIRAGTATLRQVIATREDILLNLIGYGLSPSRAFQITERVRKGRGLLPEQESEMRLSGVPDWYVASCQKIGYMFPKAHAAAYVMMAVRIAYFKVHHPAAFYATYLSVRASEFDVSLTLLDVQEMERRIRAADQDRGASPRDKSIATILEVVREMILRGLRFAPFSLATADERLFKVTQDGQIAPPIAAISGLGPNGARQIAAARDQRPFSSIADLRGRGHAPRPVIEALREIGALAGLPETDQMTLF
ncbi:MAG: PolC-type DNA polymerase III [Thermaerobacter sp.]|nr:PolC-type DNA polymerase III [Thermaerobacter sp.]